MQGSQIRPFLFIIFVSDVVDFVKKPAICKLFAKDVKLYSKIEYSCKNPITMTLQNIQEWFKNSKWKVNPIKISSIKLGRFQTNVNYSINDAAIPESQSVKDLGLTYDANMKLIAISLDESIREMVWFFDYLYLEATVLFACILDIMFRPILEY